MYGYFRPQPILVDLRLGLGPAAIGLRRRQLLVKHISTHKIRKRSGQARAKKNTKIARKNTKNHKKHKKTQKNTKEQKKTKNKKKKKKTKSKKKTTD